MGKQIEKYCTCVCLNKSDLSHKCLAFTNYLRNIQMKGNTSFVVYSQMLDVTVFLIFCLVRVCLSCIKLFLWRSERFWNYFCLIIYIYTHYLSMVCVTEVYYIVCVNCIAGRPGSDKYCPRPDCQGSWQNCKTEKVRYLYMWIL